MKTEKLPDNGHETFNTTLHAPYTIACPDKVSKTGGTVPLIPYRCTVWRAHTELKLGAQTAAVCSRAALGNYTENPGTPSSLSIKTH